MLDPVTTWMVECLQYVTNHLGQLSLLSLQVGKPSTSLPGWGYGGACSLVSGGK